MANWDDVSVAVAEPPSDAWGGLPVVKQATADTRQYASEQLGGAPAPIDWKKRVASDQDYYVWSASDEELAQMPADVREPLRQSRAQITPEMRKQRDLERSIADVRASNAADPERTQAGRDLRKAESRVPFGRSIAAARDANQLTASVQRIEKGEHTPEDMDRLAQFIVESEYLSEEEQKKPWYAKVKDSILDMAPYAFEFAVTSGAYSAGRAGTTAVAEQALGGAAKTMAGRIATGLASRGAGVAAQTAVNPAAVVAATEEQRLSAALAGEDQSFLEALPAGVVDTVAEIGSERAGGMIGKLAGKLIPRQLKTAIAEAWMAQTGGTIQDVAAAVASATGWNGIVGELGEERTGEAIRGVFGKLGVGDFDFGTTGKIASGDPQGLYDLSVEAGAMAVPGVASGAAQIAERRLARLQEIRAKGFVSAGDARVLGMTPEESRSRASRKAAAEKQAQDLKEQIKRADTWADANTKNRVGGEPSDASTVQPPQGEVREGEGRPNIRGTGKEQVPAKPAGEGAAPSEVPVAPVSTAPTPSQPAPAPAPVPTAETRPEPAPAPPEAAPQVDEARVKQLLERRGKVGNKVSEEMFRQEVAEEAEMLRKYPPGTVLQIGDYPFPFEVKVDDGTYNRKGQTLLIETGGDRRILGDNSGAGIRTAAKEGSKITVVSPEPAPQAPTTPPVVRVNKSGETAAYNESKGVIETYDRFDTLPKNRQEEILRHEQAHHEWQSLPDDIRDAWHELGRTDPEVQAWLWENRGERAGNLSGEEIHSEMVEAVFAGKGGPEAAEALLAHQRRVTSEAPTTPPEAAHDEIRGILDRYDNADGVTAQDAINQIADAAEDSRIREIAERALDDVEEDRREWAGRGGSEDALEDALEEIRAIVSKAPTTPQNASESIPTQESPQPLPTPPEAAQEPEAAIPKNIGNIRIEDVQEAYPDAEISGATDGEGWDVRLPSGDKVKIRFRETTRFTPKQRARAEKRYGAKFAEDAEYYGRFEFESRGENVPAVALIELNIRLATPEHLKHEDIHRLVKLAPESVRKELVRQYAADLPESEQEEEIVRRLNKEKPGGFIETMREFTARLLRSIGLGEMSKADSDRWLETLKRDGRKSTTPKPKPTRVSDLPSAVESAKAGKSWVEWERPISEAFVSEKIDESHPAYQEISKPPFTIDEYNAARDIYGKPVRVSLPHRKHPLFGKVTDISDDFKSVTVTDENGKASLHSPVNVDVVEDYIRHQEGRGRKVTAEREFLERQQRRPAKPKRVRKPKKPGEPLTLAQAVQELGGLDPKRVKAGGVSVYEDMKQAGVPLNVFKGAKRGASAIHGLDTMAKALESAGYWKAPEGSIPGDALLQALKAGGKTFAGTEADVAREYEEHQQELRNAHEQGITREDIEATLRSAEEAGFGEAEATEGEAAEVLGELDDSFDFGANAPKAEKAGVPGQQQGLFQKESQGSLFNVSRPPNGKSEKAVPQRSELEKIEDDLKAGRAESLPGQKTLLASDEGEGVASLASPKTEEEPDISSAIAKEFADRKKRSERAADRKEAAKKRFDDAVRRLIDPTKPTVGLDPSKVKAAVDMTLAAIDYGVASFDQFISLAVEAMGAKAVRDQAAYLEEAARQANFTGITSVEEVLGEEREPSDLTSIKNEIVNELREARGVEELPEAPAQTRDEWMEAAAASIAATNGTIGPSLVAEINRNPRNLSNIEVAILQLYYRSVNNAFDTAAKELFAATESGNPTTAAVAQTTADNLLSELVKIEEATKAAGREWGRAGVARQIVLAKDFSMAAMATRARVANAGKPLTAEQTAKVADMAKKIAELEKQLQEAEQARADMEREKRTDAEVGKQAPRRGAKREQLQKKASQAVASFKEKWGTLFQTGIISDPKQDAEKWAQITTAAVDVVKAYVDLGVFSFGEFMARVRADIGAAFADQAKDALQVAWNASKEAGEIPVPELDQKNVAAVTRIAKQVERAAVEAGITDREAVVDVVHESLQEFLPEITRREAMDAMSGYGQFSPLSKDEIARTIRDINGQLQQLAKLDDMQQGRAPAKTGVERRTPSDEERRLIQQVNEAKKRGGFAVANPETQLRTALASAKAAIRNRIADMEHEIRTKERIVRERSTLKADAELETLRKQRDELREAHQKLFPATRPGMTEAGRIKEAQRNIDRIRGELDGIRQGREPVKGTKPALPEELRKELQAWRDRLSAAKQAAKDAGLADWESEGGATPPPAELKAANRALDRAISQLEADIAAGDVAFEERPEPLRSAELDAKRARLDALRAQRDALRVEKGLTEERSRRLYEADLKKRIADYRQRVLDQNFEEKAKKEVRKLSREELDLKRELEDAKQEFFESLAEYRRANMTGLERTIDYVRETAHLSRAAMTSLDLSAVFRQGGAVVFGHPLLGLKAGKRMMQAAFSRQAEFDSVEEIRNRPNGQLYETAGLAITEQEGKITRQEEAFMGRWAKKVAPIRGSARAYTTFMNNIRADAFDALVENLGRSGAVTLDEAKVIARFVNVATGRADLGKFNSAAANLNTVFFAPRYVASRFQYLATPFLLPGMKTSGRVRKAIAMEYARHATGVAVFMGLVVGLGTLLTDDDDDEPTVELDPRSSDFGKIKIGETRIDPLSGLSQTVVFLARLATGQRKTSSGEIRAIRGEDVKFGDQTTVDAIGNFLWSKLAPVPGAVVNLLQGKNVVGEDVSPHGAATELFIPLSFREIKDTMAARGIPQGTAIAVLSILGMGTATYGPQTDYLTGTDPERQEQFAKFLKGMDWNTPDPVYSDLLTEDQRTQIENRRTERRQSVILAATHEPDRESHKSDETYQESVATRDKNIGFLREMQASGVSYAEAAQLLEDHYTASGRRTDSAGYTERIEKLAELFGE